MALRRCQGLVVNEKLHQPLPDPEQAGEEGGKRGSFLFSSHWKNGAFAHTGGLCLMGVLRQAPEYFLRLPCPEGSPWLAPGAALTVKMRMREGAWSLSEAFRCPGSPGYRLRAQGLPRRHLRLHHTGGEQQAGFVPRTLGF